MSSQQIPVAYPDDDHQQQQQSLAQSHASQPYTPGLSQQQPYHYYQHQQHLHRQNQQPLHQAQEQIHAATSLPSFHAPHQVGPESYPQLQPESQSHSHPHQAYHDSQSLEPLSCVACRARKLRCDRLPTACTRCLKGNTECVYPPSRRRQAPRRRSVKELEARLG